MTTSGIAPSHDSGSASPVASILRKVGGPLLAYHVLILGGAVLIVHGAAAGSALSLYGGLALVVGGIAIESAILVWSAGLTRRSARHPFPEAPVPPSAAGSPRPREWFCSGCGWTGPGGRGICPRCGRPAVRRPERSSGS